MQTEFTLQRTMTDALGRDLIRPNLDSLEDGPNQSASERDAPVSFSARIVSLCNRHPLFIIGALWPLVLLGPHLPGLPRPSIAGLPWRQELGLSLLLTAALALLWKRKKKDRLVHIERRSLPLVFAFVAFVAWTVASASWATNPYAAIHLGIQWTTYLVYFLVLSSCLSNSRLLSASQTTLAGVILILAVACAIESWFGAPLTDGNLRSDLKPLLRGSGGFGEIMAMSAILFGALALSAKRRGRALYFGTTAVMAWLATLQSLERAPLMGAAGGFCLLIGGVIALKSREGCPWRRLALMVAVLSLVLFLQSVPLSKTAPDGSATSTISRFGGNPSADISTRVRYLFWGVGLEMARAHPLLGVGGNNYEVSFATARAQFAARYPTSPLVSLNEDLLTVYAHNEYVQLLAELGAIGFVLFLVFSIALVSVFWRATKRRSQVLPALGAAGAMLAFAISSGASASSFRNFGGGLIFFFAAALLVRAARAPRASTAAEPGMVVRLDGRVRSRLTACLCVLMLLVSGRLSAQGAGTVLHGLAQGSAQPAAAESYYQRSLRVFPTSPATHFGYGLWLYRQHRSAEAVVHLRYAAENGFNSSICYAYLSGAAVSAGDLTSAERILATAVAAYPRSVFLLVRYSAVLKSMGQEEASKALFSRAVLVDSRAAWGWRQLIDNDIDAAYLAARADKNIAMPGELVPQAAMFEILQENEQRFPGALNTGWRARMRSLPLR